MEYEESNFNLYLSVLLIADGLNPVYDYMTQFISSVNSRASSNNSDFLLHYYIGCPFLSLTDS